MNLRVAHWSVALLAAWGVLLTLAIATGAWPVGMWPMRAPQLQHEHTQRAAHEVGVGGGVQDVAPALPLPSVPPPPPAIGDIGSAAPTSILAARYAVCAREESPPVLSRVRLSDKGRDLWALHCGASAHVLAIEDAAGALVARRVLTAQVRSHNTNEAPRAVRISAGDVDGDGRADLLLPVLFTDRAGAPASGALSWLHQRVQGGFDMPPRAIDVAVGDVALAALDTQKGQDLALLQLGDARAARNSELWLLHGGPAPLRYARLPAGVGPSAVAAADLDRDGLDDVAVVSEHEGRLRLWLSSRSAEAPGEPLLLELEGAREVFAGDVDGDGARDLVITGARVWLLLARSDFRPEPTAVAGSEGLRDVQLEDADADGKLDLIGYAHPSLIALEQSAPLTFERRTLATLHGDLGVLFVRAAQLDADGHPDLVLVVVGNTADAQLEVAVAANVHDGIAVQLADHVDAIRDTPLIERFTLP